MKKNKNTLQKGRVRYIVFKEGDSWYAVGLEFNIVESGDTHQEALLLLFEALSGYVEAAQKIKVRPSILNQKTDSEYEEMWQNRQEEKFVKSRNIYSSGELNIGQILRGSAVPA
jgi:predicted RNase H-like HicB family nuclease